MSQTQPPTLSPNDVRALVRDDALWERAGRTWKQGGVGNAARRGRLLMAQVQGTEPLPYNTSAEPPRFRKKKWSWHCTCAYHEIHGGPCKHAIALLLEWAARPENFAAEASLDEQLATERRAEWLALIRESLYDSPALQRLLALEPEPRRRLGRPLNLSPFDEQLRYALNRHAGDTDKQQQLFGGILETAAGYLRVGDAANAARLTTLLIDRLLAVQERPRPLTTLLMNALTLLEAAALDATWDADEQAAWLRKVMGWWEAAELETSDRLMDLILHCYRAADQHPLERWLRDLLRKPVHANQQSSALWRQRVLAFLLAFYDVGGRDDAFLDLCWEEGEDALAARKLVEMGEVAEALDLAQQGLRGCEAHLTVAEALLQRGNPDAARIVATAGLRYHDRGRGALLAWLGERALDTGDPATALSLAQQAWEQAATLDRYRLLREAALRSEAWPDLRRELHAALEHRGEVALLVEVLMDEEEWQSAAALLPLAGARREELTAAVAHGLAAGQPDDAIHLLFDLADLRADEKTRPAYARAAHALLAAQSLAGATNHETIFAARLHDFLQNHSRQSALKEELARQEIS